MLNQYHIDATDGDIGLGAPLEAELEAEGSDELDDEDWNTDDVDIDHDPCMNPQINQYDTGIWE